jgi:hypothetical protein
MSDGPFKNLKLPQRWKVFSYAVQNEAFERSHCCALASHALLMDIFSKNITGLLLDLQRASSQVNLKPSTLDEMFNAFGSTPFSKILQKELAWRVSGSVVNSDAIKEALSAAVMEQARQANDRIVDQCIISREFGNMRQDQFNLAVRASSSILNSISIDPICQALFAGNRNFFKDSVSKKTGLEDGPSL